MNDEESIGSDVKATFDQIAEDFDRTRIEPWKECVEYAKSMRTGSIVLDMGCGNGRNCIFLAENHRVIGVDISREMLLFARRNVEKRGLSTKCDFLQSDVAKLPIRDSVADETFCIATLHHIPTVESRLKVVMELKRTLKTGGRALISVWAFDQPRFENILKEHLKGSENFGDTYVEWNRSDGRKFKRFYHLFLGEELKELALKAGLRVNEHYKSNDNYYAVVEK
jgi:tRNA (uracil-5-)-methyltransferase TRM9